MSPLPRLILISGWAYDASSMAKLAKGLETAADVSSVSTADLWDSIPGAGPSSVYAQNLEKMIQNNDGPVFLAGWSLGGMIALETACRRPGLVAGMILISSTPKFCSGPEWGAGARPAALRAMEMEFKRDARKTLSSFFERAALPLGESERTLAGLVSTAGAMDPLALSAGLQYLAAKDLRAEASAVNIPVLILHGNRDQIVPVEAGALLANMLPRSKLRVYDNYGHALPCQNPHAIAEDIIRFIVLETA